MIKLGLVLLLCGLAASLDHETADERNETLRNLRLENYIDDKNYVSQLRNDHNQIRLTETAEAARHDLGNLLLGRIRMAMDNFSLKAGGTVSFTVNGEGLMTTSGTTVTYLGSAIRGPIGVIFTATETPAVLRSGSADEHPRSLVINTGVNLAGIMLTNVDVPYNFASTSVTKTATGMTFTVVGNSLDTLARFNIAGTMTTTSTNTFTFSATGTLSRPSVV